MKVVISSGDPAGCGPYITLRAIEAFKNKNISFFVFGDEEIFLRYPVYRKIRRKFHLVDCATPNIKSVKPGFPSKLCGAASFNYLNKSLEFTRKNRIKRLVTSPLSKEAVGLIYPGFKGHTEYLAKYFNTKRVEMMMVSEKVKLLLFTRHISLKDVSSYIKKESLLSTIDITYCYLKKYFKIKHPKIVFVSLNPHAGLNTYLGKEEKIIVRVIKESDRDIYGPYPCDTIFSCGSAVKYDCVICLYHDQGMTPFKMLSLRHGVNATLGLPIIRTSPAHGVAYDIIREDVVYLKNNL